MSVPRDHHYVPVSFMEPWTKDGLLDIFYKNENGQVHHRRSPPKSVMYERDLYSNEILNPKTIEAQALEHGLLQIVDDRARFIQIKLLAGEIPTDVQERSWWITFIMSLIHRLPKDIKKGKLIHRALWDEQACKTIEWAKNEFPDLTEEEVKSILFKNSQDLKENSRISSLANLMTSEFLGNYLGQLEWLIVDASDVEVSLLLSNSPLFRTQTLKQAYDFIALPISPTKAFVATPTFGAKTIKSWHRLREWVRTMNKEALGRAEKFVIGNAATEHRFAKRYFASGSAKSVIDIIEEEMRKP